MEESFKLFIDLIINMVECFLKYLLTHFHFFSPMNCYLLPILIHILVWYISIFLICRHSLGIRDFNLLSKIQILLLFSIPKTLFLGSQKNSFFNFVIFSIYCIDCTIFPSPKIRRIIAIFF